MLKSYDGRNEQMRVVNREARSIGYKLNLVGLRVYRDQCMLVGRIGQQWMPIGSPRPLPLEVPLSAATIGDDALLITAFQYDQERPGTDMRDVLAQRRNFDEALNDNGPHK